ncbi:MAG: YneF family protein [Mycoplasmataceae bacterium]|nr:YneF family protein [Mycoplasmataceae bacterium]
MNLTIFYGKEIFVKIAEHSSGLCAGDIVAIVLGVLIPIIIFLTFYITRKLIEKQLKDNPPISEAQIRAMFMSMGRKPSEAQIRNTMNSMKNAKNNSFKKRK